MLLPAPEAAEQHGGWLLAEAQGTLFGGDVGQLAMMAGAAVRQDWRGDDHAGTDGTVGQAVDDDERAGSAVAVVAVQGDGGIQADLDATDLVQLQGTGSALLQGVHIDLVGDAGDRARHVAGGALDVVLLAWEHRLLGHPYQHGVELVSDRRNVVGMHQQIATGDVDLVFHGQGHGLAWACVFQLTFEGDDGLDPAALARRQHDHFVPLCTTPLAMVPAKPRKFRFDGSRTAPGSAGR